MSKRVHDIHEASGSDRSYTTWSIVAVLLLAVACGQSGAAPVEGAAEAPAIADPQRSPGCDALPEAGLAASDEPSREVVIDGTARSYLLFVPTSRYQTPPPLVLNHHGLTQDAGDQRVLTGFDELAERKGVVVAYPDAGDRNWNFEDESDVAYITALIADVGSSTCIDPTRIYAIGMSQGGGFSTLLACRLPDRIAAVASVAVLHHHDSPACDTPVPSPVLTVLGKNDRIYSIDEGLMITADVVDAPGPLATETDAWIETNGCAPDPVKSEPTEGVERMDYSCPRGNDLAVVVHDAGHIWPDRELHNLDTNQVIWEFLSKYAKA